MLQRKIHLWDIYETGMHGFNNRTQSLGLAAHSNILTYVLFLPQIVKILIVIVMYLLYLAHKHALY